MTQAEYDNLNDSEKTGFIKEKDSILAYNNRLRYILLTVFNLMVVKTTTTNQDMYGKVDIECIDTITKKTVFVQIKYSDKDWGDVRISSNEITALKQHRSLTRYQIQLVGNQDYLNLTNDVLIKTIRVCKVDFLEEMLEREDCALILEDSYIPNTSVYSRVGFGFFYYPSPEHKKLGKKDPCCMVANSKTNNIKLVLKSIDSPNRKRCYLIPANINEVLLEPAVWNFEESYFSELPF